MAKTVVIGEKLVKIRLPKERRDQEDVFVGVNERTWLIKRGVDVEVPECVAEVLKNREDMLETIMAFENAQRRAD
ncbi:MAG: hypothetical protein J6J62_05535 [Oscillospiraceae bacterium]|nr:hypothetical protein [Oscillospiraceae bacterium]